MPAPSRRDRARAVRGLLAVALATVIAVIALDSRTVDACRDLQTLMDDARWLDPQTIVPLVETRMHAIVRRGRSGVTTEWDGGVLIAGPGGPK